MQRDHKLHTLCFPVDSTIPVESTSCTPHSGGSVLPLISTIDILTLSVAQAPTPVLPDPQGKVKRGVVTPQHSVTMSIVDIKRNTLPPLCGVQEVDSYCRLLSPPLNCQGGEFVPALADTTQPSFVVSCLDVPEHVHQLGILGAGLGLNVVVRLLAPLLNSQGGELVPELVDTTQLIFIVSCLDVPEHVYYLGNVGAGKYIRLSHFSVPPVCLFVCLPVVRLGHLGCSFGFMYISFGEVHSETNQHTE